ncbi:hypothetical protein AB0K87_36970, partial [Streptomyces sp. NPDC053705]|uniref:hypothetical protein n=1 Tax=Streptomyces sp. NPDC053705 TaxID=3156668 RepID=UPI00341FC36D
RSPRSSTGGRGLMKKFDKDRLILGFAGPALAFLGFFPSARSGSPSAFPRASWTAGGAEGGVDACAAGALP